MHELPLTAVEIDDPFWTPRQQTNSRQAIFHQWKQLESTGCIDNFRIAAGEKEGFREGWFFADSDAYKWLDAAVRIHTIAPDGQLKQLMDDFIALIARTQMDDGYIYTYNQIHFPGERWGNLMIEHELYCHGHLIEALVSHFEAAADASVLNLGRKAADLLVRDFLSTSVDKTSGHEEIEIALLRLYQVTHHSPYLDLARLFLERRGKVRPFFPLILQQNARVTKRGRFVREQRLAYLENHPEHETFQLPPNNFARKGSFARVRWMLNSLAGKYFQQHTPIRRQTSPVGHAVRFGYLETAIAMLARLDSDSSLLPALQQAWERMVSQRMYVTGGVGSRPEIEGFGRDYELDPQLAYAETCAALASLFWNWQMTLLSGYAQYADIFEWQLYNAAAVGMGLDGTGYLYNNPLLCRGGITRLPWFQVPCCPSNLSRTWASLGKYIYSHDEKEIWVHQYIGSQAAIPLAAEKCSLRMESSLPWSGNACIHIEMENPLDFTLHVRIPSWAGRVSLRLNGEPLPDPQARDRPAGTATASGYDPRLAWYFPIHRTWSPGDFIELDFEMPIRLLRAHPRVRGHNGKVTITRGPLVYCLESCDNPDMDIHSLEILPATLEIGSAPDLLGGITSLSGKTSQGSPFVAIPYSLWANRGESQMSVWINCK